MFYLCSIELCLKTGHYLELLTLETMKLLRSTKNKIIKDKNDEYKPHLENIEVILVHWNIAKNDYLISMIQDSVPNNLFGQLIDISPKNFIFLKTFQSEFSNIDVWLTDQNSKAL